MATKEKVLEEIERIRPEYYDVLLNFINSLTGKSDSSIMETALLSESALAKDWLRPEEDEAWADL